MGRTPAAARRGIRLARLRPVLGARLLAVRDAGGVERPARDFARRRVRFLGRGRIHARAYPPPLGRRYPLLAPLAGLEAGRGDLLLGLAAALADELVDAGHAARDGSNAPGARRCP